MSRIDKRAVFASMERAKARRQQMDETKKREILEHLTEYNGMVQNLTTLSMISAFLNQVMVRGSEARDLSRCLGWVDGMTQGMTARRDELKAKLPKENMEIKMGPEAPDSATPSPEPQEPAQSAGVSVGSMELQKGEPVLGAI